VKDPTRFAKPGLYQPGLCFIRSSDMTGRRGRRFPPPWTVESIPGGYKVLDAEGQSLAYVYGVEGDPHVGKTLTLEEARRTASNIAKVPSLLKRTPVV
jgi:hypothetical protein